VGDYVYVGVGVYFLEAWVGFVDWYSGGESGAAGCAGGCGCVEL